MRRSLIAWAVLMVVIATMAVCSSKANADGDNGVYYFESTAYTWTGNRTASGEWPYVGGVACNVLPLGTKVKVLDGPLAGTKLVVNDRIGAFSDFDIYLNSEWEALQYGRRAIAVEIMTQEMNAKDWLHEILREYGAHLKS